jgi:hypothetical protein
VKPPQANSALPPPTPLARAAPQCISGRTSYLRVRLAFHPHPQLIRAVCNRHRFGPPCPIRDTSPWPWVAHTVSGLPPATEAPYSGSRSLRLRLFSCLNQATEGNSSGHTPKGTPSHSRGMLRLHGSTRFQGLFHSPRRGTFHRSLTVLCTIGQRAYRALGSGLPSFPPGSSCLAVLRNTTLEYMRTSTRLSRSMAASSKRL